MGIKVLAPDVNESFVDFTAVPSEMGVGDIRFGLGAVRNVGTNVVEGIRVAREEKGRFLSFHDFLEKVPLHVTNKRTVDSLIKAGSFDSLGSTRRALEAVHEAATDGAAKRKREEAGGQVGFDFDGLWDETETLPDLVPAKPEWDKRSKLAFEREMLGLYVSDHPLAGLEIPLAKHMTASITEILGGDIAGDGEHVTIAGLVTSVQHRVARNSGNQYGIVTIEDFAGEISVMFLGKTYQEFSPALTNDAIVVVRGRVSVRDDGMNLHAVSMFTPDVGPGLGAGPLVITMNEHRATTEVVSALNDVLIRHAGENEVRLKLVKDQIGRVFEIPYPVTVSADLYGELKTLLGPNCLG
jgi:DNA polymerase-3 subunit alpha